MAVNYKQHMGMTMGGGGFSNTNTNRIGGGSWNRKAYSFDKEKPESGSSIGEVPWDHAKQGFNATKQATMDNASSSNLTNHPESNWNNGLGSDTNSQTPSASSAGWSGNTVPMISDNFNKSNNSTFSNASGRTGSFEDQGYLSEMQDYYKNIDDKSWDPTAVNQMQSFNGLARSQVMPNTSTPFNTFNMKSPEISGHPMDNENNIPGPWNQAKDQMVQSLSDSMNNSQAAPTGQFGFGGMEGPNNISQGVPRPSNPAAEEEDDDNMDSLRKRISEAMYR